MFLGLLTIIMLALGNTSAPAARPDQDVEYLREFGNRARVRVVREVLVDDLQGLMERQRAEVRAEMARPATRRAFQGERTARYRVMFSPGPELPEREVLVEHDWATMGRRDTYHTWAAELSDDNVLVLVYSSSEQDCLYAIDLEPPAGPGFEPRPRLPQEALRVPWRGRPTFLSAAVTGTLLGKDLTVTILRRTQDLGPRRTSTSQPALELRRHSLHRVDNECRWVLEAEQD